MRHITLVDRYLSAVATAAAALAGPTSVRAYPQRESPDEVPLSEEQKRASAALMRVNHVGEVCAQALYTAQALTAHDPHVRKHHETAAAEESEHLAWTRARVMELGGHTSWLNPFWYAGAFSIGLLAGRAGDRASLGFVAETERQVERHLSGHLQRLPVQDTRSRAIVERMRDDEIRHGRAAEAAGALAPPWPVRWCMRAAAKIMTTVAHHV